MSFWKKYSKYSVVLISAAAFFLLLPFLHGAPDSVQTGFVINADRIVVIDAGHGGIDGGAVSSDGVVESELNLGIARQLDNIFGFCGVAAVLTRDSGEIAYPPEAATIRARKAADLKERVRLINSTPGALLISIHQNKYTTSQPSGAQVFYSDTQGSRDLAVYTQETLRLALDADNSRQAKKIGSDIYMMNNINCTAILVECGFLSNPRDVQLLGDDAYRLKVAYSIACAYFGYFGGTNEG